MKRLFFFILFLACLLIPAETRAQGTAYQIISGTLANRPTGCSIIGAVDVYAGTDTSKLYICKAANTWGTGIPLDAPASGGTVNSGLINQLAWYAANGTTLSGLATANSGVLVTSAGGVPSISSTLPSGIILVAPVLGTPASGVMTNVTGTASGLTAGNVTTNANLTGPITSVGNATSIASQTGTGTKFVVDTNPTLVGPTLGVALATSLNGNTFTTGTYTLTGGSGKILTFNNTLTITNTDGITATLPTTSFTAARTDAGQTFTGVQVMTSPTVNQPNIVGVTDASSAAAGSAGEFIESVIDSGASVALTTNTLTNVTSIALTAGDWDVTGVITFGATAATITDSRAGINTTSATLPSTGNYTYDGGQLTVATVNYSATVARFRINVSGSVTAYLVARATFSAGTINTWGKINARRVR